MTILDGASGFEYNDGTARVVTYPSDETGIDP